MDRNQPSEETAMTLQEKLDAFKADFKAGKPPYNAPPEIHPIMERATRELIASGLAQRALKIGDKAPDFTLPDPNGRAVSSAALLANGPLIVSFYRGVWFRTLDLQALQEALRNSGSSAPMWLQSLRRPHRTAASRYVVS